MFYTLVFLNLRQIQDDVDNESTQYSTHIYDSEKNNVIEQRQKHLHIH